MTECGRDMQLNLDESINWAIFNQQIMNQHWRRNCLYLCLANIANSWGYLLQLRSYLKEEVAAPVFKTENTPVVIRRTDCDTPLFAEVGANFADRRL
jgi:hypothetical protein